MSYPGQPALALPEAAPRLSATESYLRVLHALMLRDMRTRFGASYWGYAVVVLWPCAHVFMLVAIYYFRKVPAPIGESSPIFFASGAVPVLVYQYMSREVMKSVGANRPLTYYPQVKLIDVIIARLLVEIVSGSLTLITVLAILTALGIDPRPADPFTAVTGFLAAILLGIGIGFVNVCIMAFFPTWALGYVLFNIIIYITSGVMFLPNYLPEQLYAIFKYNPAVQIIEWVRLGYYPTLDVQVDYFYVIMFGLTTLSIGLLMERFVVRRLS
ncbi:Polysialic acid transport protein KpsM [Methylobacterium hispanicum]|jgi:capsular polysaccharide transport system permease protein|uniref:Polysialic acid transport protein KpsM n=1 Tax=Methylobacterium hispanicum TaxID=270350 RepID=A0AAV4ZPK7_9HYPH|nr:MULTISPECIES: ABC transporter permease [Methylobacterium]GJD90485.1 Polysialic acid transport protein KpsM [Methylobacterium hispanicum]